jgi:hypothetical protein
MSISTRGSPVAASITWLLITCLLFKDHLSTVWNQSCCKGKLELMISFLCRKMFKRTPMGKYWNIFSETTNPCTFNHWLLITCLLFKDHLSTVWNQSCCKAFNIFQVYQYFIIYRQYFFLKFGHFSWLSYAAVFEIRRYQRPF